MNAIKTLTAALLIFGSFVMIPPTADAQETNTEEIWTGVLDAGITKLRLNFVIDTDSAGKQTAQMISVDQGNAKVPVDEFSVGEKEIEFVLKRIQGRFKGKLNEAGDECEGKWTQGPRTFPLTLKKKAAGEAPDEPAYSWDKRPQKPKGPFPYTEEEVSIEDATTGVTLAGTLTLPKNEKVEHLIVLVSGSGPQDREETLMEHKPFAVIADYFARRGIAVMRYDDRGTAKSTGDFGKERPRTLPKMLRM